MHELLLPAGSVGLPPQFGLDDVDGQHGASRRRFGQRAVVVDAQVALEPDQVQAAPIAHRAARRLRRQRSEQ
jgi:hypothetical protein